MIVDVSSVVLKKIIAVERAHFISDRIWNGAAVGTVVGIGLQFAAESRNPGTQPKQSVGSFALKSLGAVILGGLAGIVVDAAFGDETIRWETVWRTRVR